MSIESFQISQRVDALEQSIVELRTLVHQTAESCKHNSESLGRVLDALEGSLKRDGIVDDLRAHGKRIEVLERIAANIRSYSIGIVAACTLIPSIVDFVASRL